MEDGIKITKENIDQVLETEIAVHLAPALKKNKVYPMIVIGMNFGISDGSAMSLFANPNLDTPQKRIAMLQDALNSEIEKSKQIN